MTSKTKDDLEARIAAALKPDAELDSIALGALLDEVEAAAAAADEAATKAHADALDPSTTVDAAKVGAAVATATLTRDRLQAALLPLEELCAKVADAEYESVWRSRLAEIEVERNDLAIDLQDRYPVLVAELIALVQRIPVVDRKINDLHAAAPQGVWDRLEDVQRAARDIEGKFGDAGYGGPLNLLTDLKLPTFEANAKEQYLWPPAPEPAPIPSFGTVQHSDLYTSNWHVAQRERDQRWVEANR